MFNKMRAVTFAALMLATASPIVVNNTAVAQIQRPTKIASTVLATVNGQQLTQSMVNSAIELGEFMAGHKFTAAEKQWIINSEVKMFRNNPSEEIQAYRQIAQILSQIKQSRDPVQLAQARENLMANIYLTLLQNNHVNTPSTWTIVYKYSPVLFADPKYKVVVTKRTIDSLVASRNFVAKLAGKPLMPINYHWWAQYLQQKYYKELSPRQRQYYVTAESRWVRLQQAWSKTSPQKRQEVTAFINQKLQDGIKTPSIARYLEYNVSGGNTAGMDDLLSAIRQEHNTNTWTTKILPQYGRYMDNIRMYPARF